MTTSPQSGQSGQSGWPGSPGPSAAPGVAQETGMAGDATAPGAAVPRWERRFRVPRHTLPAWAKSNPQRCVFVSDLPGAAQVFCWDRDTGRLRQVTDSPGGSRDSAVEASGEAVWWFRDGGGDELGVWMRQPFHGGPDEPVSRDIAPGWQAGLAMGLGGHALIGVSDPEGTAVHLLRPDGTAAVVYRHEEPAMAVDLSRGLDLLAILHTEDGDLWNPRVRVLRPDGTAVRDIGESGEPLEAVGFAPVRGDNRLLLRELRGDRWEPLIVDAATGERFPVTLGLPGEVDGDWYQDGSGLLVRQDHGAHSRLYRHDLAGGRLTPLDVPRGTVEHARTRPDGGVWYIWSSTERPPAFTTLGEPSGFVLPGPQAPPSTPARERWVDGPGGPVPVLLNLPAGERAPHPAVFLLHGGPDEQDRDTFDPEAAGWLDHGFAVVRVNYRGSSGYGEKWQQALRERVGHTELEDVAAVRAVLVSEGTLDPDRLVLAGGSWGGYLTLLGLGTQPDLWAAGVATAPVADSAVAYEDERDDVKALDRMLFGGSPEEVPERYADSSPLTYAAAVRAPVLIIAGRNDPRCPPRQIGTYTDALAVAGAAFDVHWHDTGHSSAVTQERVDAFRHALSFVLGHLGPEPGRSACTTAG